MSLIKLVYFDCLNLMFDFAYNLWVGLGWVGCCIVISDCYISDCNNLVGEEKCKNTTCLKYRTFHCLFPLFS